MNCSIFSLLHFSDIRTTDGLCDKQNANFIPKMKEKSLKEPSSVTGRKRPAEIIHNIVCYDFSVSA